MTLRELKVVIDAKVAISERYLDMEVRVPASGNGAVGGTSSIGVRDFRNGIDWDHNFFFLYTNENLKIVR